MESTTNSSNNQGDIKMLRVACYMCFFAFLRAREMSVPSDNEHDPAAHLSTSDIAVDKQQEPSIVRIHIK